MEDAARCGLVPKRLSFHIAGPHFHVKFNLPDSAGQTERTRIHSPGIEVDRGVRRSCCSSWAAANLNLDG